MGFKGVLKKFNGCLRKSFKDVSRMSQGSFKGVPRKNLGSFKKNLKGVSRKFQGYLSKNEWGFK